MTKQLDIFEDKKTYIEEINNLKSLINKIIEIVNNKDITGIEAKLMIIDVLNEYIEGNDNKWNYQ